MMYQTLIEPVDKFIAHNYMVIALFAFIVGALALIYAYIAKQWQEYCKLKQVSDPQAIREYILNQPAD